MKKIIDMWATPVWVGSIDAATLQATQGALAHSMAPTDTPVSGAILDGRTSFAADIEATASQLDLSLDGPPLGWQHTVECWGPGHHVGITYSAAVVQVLAIIVSTPAADTSDSGVISLRDPRPGAANVSVPGLPWGRSIPVPAHAGVVIAAPGWVAVSVAPLRPGHAMTVWRATGHRPPA